MKSNLISESFTGLQDKLYDKLNEFSHSHKILGRMCSVPVSVLDVTLDTVKMPVRIIECVAMAAINLIGAAFFDKYTLKDALAHTDWALGVTANIPVKVVMMPLKIAFQFFAILINPEKVQSINYFKKTFA
ncbi:MAG: hypothetical protein K0S07_410 [Chlamydiales bacterium]|jgi:hypothetical protein|nr:hypothetical protein [Chlamydiales bacterium]